MPVRPPGENIQQAGNGYESEGWKRVLSQRDGFWCHQPKRSYLKLRIFVIVPEYCGVKREKPVARTIGNIQLFCLPEPNSPGRHGLIRAPG